MNDIKKIIKNILFSMIGELNTRRLIRKVKGSKVAFSEAELVLEFFLSRKKIGTMVDVGAHFGESFKDYLNNGWKIVAFEPDSKNRRQLEKQIDASCITLHSVAVSNQESEGVSFYASEESDGISGLSAFRPSHVVAEQVSVTTLDKALDSNEVKEVTFLKIDTEGHDLFVLEGFPWHRYKPEVILCEFEDKKTNPLGYNYKNIGNLLKDKEYYVYVSEWEPIVKYGGKHTWRSWKRYPCELKNPEGWGNFVALKEPLPSALIKSHIDFHLSNF